MKQLDFIAIKVRYGLLALATLLVPVLNSGDVFAEGISFVDMNHQASCKQPKEGPPGPPGPQGPQGPAGPAVSIDSLFTALGSAGIFHVFAAGAAIPFDQPNITTGVNILHTVPNTNIILVSPGVYYVNFIAYTADMSTLGGVQLELNGSLIGEPQYLITPGATLPLQFPVTVVVPMSVLRVVIPPGPSLVIGSNGSTAYAASIQIIKLS